MTNDEAKVAVIEYLLFDKQFIACFTETANSADVFGIKKSFLTTEIEVKTRREDLLNELHTINFVLGNTRSNLRQRSAKYWKHATYLKTENSSQVKYVPNEFWLAMPKEIVDHRLHGLNTPYGILIIDGEHISVMKEAEKLHKDKITIDQSWDMVRRASWENYYLRRKLKEKGGELNDIIIPNP